MPDNLPANKIPLIGGLVSRIPVVGGLVNDAWDLAETVYDLGKQSGGAPRATPPLISGNIEGGFMPDQPAAPARQNEGWFEGQQWWDPGEIGRATAVEAPSGNGQVYPGCKITLPVQQRVRYHAPPGYVVVRPPRADGSPGPPVGMLKRVAQTCKLWRPKRKPPISTSDWTAYRKAARVAKKLERVVKMSNQITGKADFRRVRPHAHGKKR